MHGQFHRACVCRSIFVSKRREREEEGEKERRKKKRCWVHDSCKPRGHTSPRLAPPLAIPFSPFRSPSSPSICLSLFSTVSLHLPPGSSFIESPGSVVYCGLREERRGEGEIRGGSWGKRWLRHKPAIPARMTGDYVIRRDVRVLVCTGSRARSFVRSLARPACVPRDARFTNEPRPPGSNSPH